ncbi:MAG: YbaB/EbfC family nucleoid-associated protein [Bdellovibrionales bacterium]|nr:YbaB/EbfC family nucleoid-associated protein [Bdellovibrionales bacterium]
MGFPGDLQGMLAQAQQLQQSMLKAKEEVEKKVVEASVGGGMVVAQVNGRGELVSLAIEREVVNPDDVAMLQDLVRAAVNEAVRKSKAMMQEEMSKVTGGLPIPGL